MLLGCRGESTSTTPPAGTATAAAPPGTPVPTVPVSTATGTPSPGPTARGTPSPAPSQGGQPPDGRIERPGSFSLSYPDTWQTGGVVVATEFAQGADCVSVRIVDREAPATSGQAPFLYQTAFQVCARALDGRTLAAFMEATYGAGKGGFTAVEVGGRDAYRLDQGPATTIFLQSNRYRFQLVASVVAEAPLQALRSEQIRAILESFQVN